MELIRDWWVQILFGATILITIIKFIKSMAEATKCSLRNDILDIYDRCKESKKITHYQLESIRYSSELYFKLKGNSFVQDVVNRVNQFELID